MNFLIIFSSNFQFAPQRLLTLTINKGKKTYRKDPKLNIVIIIINHRMLILLFTLINTPWDYASITKIIPLTENLKKL